MVKGLLELMWRGGPGADEIINCVFIERWPLFSLDGHKHKKSLRQKLDSLSKEKSKDKGRGCFWCCCSCHLPTNRLLSDPVTDQTRWGWRPELFVFVENWPIRIWRAVKMPEGALAATPTATIWQESHVFCQKSRKNKTFKWWVVTAARLVARRASSSLHPPPLPQLFTKALQSLQF